MATKNKKTGFNLAGNNKKYGFRTIPNESVQWSLQTADGKYFGDVSYEAYKAAEGGTLSSYNPKNDEEAKTLEAYKEHIGKTNTITPKGKLPTPQEMSAGTLLNKKLSDSIVSTQYNADNQLTESQKAYKKFAVDKKSDVEGINNEQKLLGGDTAQWVQAPEKSWLDKTVDNVKDFVSDTFLSGTNAGRIYDELTGFKDNKASWTDDQLASLAITALHNADSGDSRDLAIVDEAYARLSRSSKYKDSDLVLALGEAQKSWGASPLKAAGINTAAAVVGMGSDIASFANSLGADKVPLLKDLANSAVEAGKEVRAKASEYNKGTYGESLGVLTQGVVNLIPYAFLGTGKAASATLSQYPKYATYLKTIAQNPSFYYSLTTMWGQKYQEALDNGASREDALANAMLYAIPAALIEVGGGIGSQDMGTEKLSETVLGEIGEEIAQDIVSGISDKSTTNPELPILSFTEDAVVNPVELAKTALYTAPIVAVAGGAHRIANLAYQKKQLQKLTNNQKTIDAVTKFSNDVYSAVLGEDAEATMPQMSNAEIKKVGELYSNRADLRMLINEGLKSPEGSNSRMLAEQLNKKFKANEKISNKEIGELVVENIKQITLEDSPDYISEKNPETETTPTASTIEETPMVNVGETFVENNTNKTIKVVERNDNATTIEINVNGKSETKLIPNKTADILATDDKYTKVETDKTIETPTDETSKKTINLKRTGNYYVAFGDEAIALAKELDEPTKKVVVNGVETDVLRLPATLMEQAAPTMSDNFNFVFSDKPSIKASENSPVVNETVATDETTSSEAENEAEIKKANVVNAINDTLTPEAKKDLANGEIKDNLGRVADVLMEVYESQGSIEGFENFFADNGAKVISVLKGEVDTSVEQAQETSKANSNDVLKNQHESDTIEENDTKSTTEPKAVESEENGNERKDLLHNYAKGNDESSGEQVGRIQSPHEEVGERITTAERLRNEGRTERINIDENNYCDIIHEDDYTESMNELSAFLKRYGLTVKFFVGSGINSTENIEFCGCMANRNDIYIQYDHAVYTPEMIAKHELIHALYSSRIIKKIRNILQNSYSKAELNHILNDGRYAGYMEFYKDTGKVFEEFVCDTLSGMNGHSFVFENLVDAFWDNNYDVIDNYKVNEYAEETDAGGEETETNEYNKGDVRYSAKTKYNEYNSLGMQWAYSSSTEIGDRKVLYKPRIKKYVLVEATKSDVGFIELKTGTYKQLREEMEYYETEKQRKNSSNGIEETVDQVLRDSWLGQNNNDGDNVDVGNRGAGIQDVEVSKGKSASNGTADTQTSDGNLNDGIRLSLSGNSKDSNGNTLSKEQVEYFKDSKVRDADGNLKVMYRGDSSEFTVFEKKKTSHSNYYGRGFYFTDSKSHAEQYGDAREFYLDIKNPLSPKQNAITKEQMLNFLKAIENDGEDYDLYNYGEGATAESVLNSVWGKGDFEMLQDINAGAIGDLVAAVELFNEVNGTSYDGIVLPTETVTFNSEQAKLTSNPNPTKDKDIRYSISKEQDADYLKAVENGDKETAQKMVDEVAEKAGYDIKAYHGTPNNDFTVFDKNRVGKGTDQYGAGFYFASNKDAARSYGTRVIDSRLSVKNPLKINGSSNEGANLIDAGYDYLLTEKQAYEVIKRLPNIYDSEESPLGDYYDAYWENGAEEWMIEDLASNEFNRNIGYLDSDLFRNYPNELHEALRDVVGYDGIEVSFANGDKFYVAWFDNQMKSAEPVTHDNDGDVIPLSERFNDNKNDIRYSLAKEESYAPTFYSHMSKVIDEIKQDKIGANSVVSYLKGKGVKNEEIKWTGIEEFLDGKKSVTKAELQEFVASNQLQIEEVTRDNRKLPYSREQADKIGEYESEQNEIFEELKREWKKAIGTDLPMRTFGNDLESSVVRLIMETDRQIKESNSGSEYENAKEELWSIFVKEDFGYDLNSEAFHDAVRTPVEFMEDFELTDEQQAIFKRFIKAKENFQKAEGIPADTKRHLKDIAAKHNDISRKINRIKNEHTEENEKYNTKWDEYKLDGGANYREITFKMPNSDYSNYAMQAHWGGDNKGILAHARIQDFDVYGKKMLFIEEIQSDWHNEGHNKGYAKSDDADIRKKRQELENYIKSRLGKENSTEEITKLQEARREYIRLGQNMSNADAVPDAPFRNNYHEYVLKRLIRMAAEQGYDSVGWTTADIQSERWSEEFAERYRIEYDQDIPKFLNKYGKKWGAKVEKAEIGKVDGHWEEKARWVEKDGTEVWSMNITDSMKDSVLYEGQPRYSFSEENNLETQKKIESIAEDIGSHDELIEYAKQNTKEFVAKIKQNENLQKRLSNAKRQMLLSPKPAVNAIQVGKITKEILAEMDSTLKATDLKDEVMSIYNEYFAEIKEANGVESKVQTANDNMMDRFAKLAIDIINSSEALTESENYEALKSYIRNTRIRVPDSAKADAHYAEFRKSHMGTFNLTNDGLDIDVAYMELCGMFPGIFNEEITHPADQLNEIANVLDNLKPYAYNPHLEYMEDAVDHVVFRFTSEVDGLAAMPKTKAQKIAERSAYDKEMALDKERAKFEQKLDKHKRDSENLIRKLQKKIDDADYVSYWDKRLSKEEKAQAVQNVRDKRDVAILKSKIRNIVSDMKKNLDKTEKAGGYPKELVQAAAEVCSVLDFHTDKTQKDGSPTKVSLKLDTLKMEYDALKNNPNYDFASEYSKELSDQIEELRNFVKNKRVVDLKKSELSKLKDILSEISQRLSNARKQIGLDAVKLNADMAEEIIESLKSKSDLVDLNQKLIMKKGKLAVQWVKAFLLNPHRVNKMISGYDTDSAWWQLQDALNRGNRKAGKFLMEATKPFDELTDGGGNEIAFYDYRTKKFKTGIKYTDGSEVEIPKSIICEMVMMWDRKDGRTHLEAGGATIPDVELYNKGDTLNAITSGKRTLPIAATDIARLKGMLDSYDKAWIERAHHLFNKVSKDATNETSLQLVGRELATEENYIRMYVNQDFVGKEIGKDQDGNITLEGHGSLKETKPQAKQPLLFRGLHENVYDNIDFTSKYYGLAIPIRNFNKVYQMTFRNENGQSSVREIIGKKFGAEIRNKVVERYIKELQTPRKRDHSIFDANKSRWLGATFWGNISSTLKQTSSYWSGAAMLSEDSLVKGLKNFAKSPKRTKAEINKYSGTLYKRSQGLSTTELGDRANRKRLAGASSKITKFINEKAPKLRNIPQGIRPENWLQAMDVNTSAALWEACKIEVAKTMKASDDGYMQAVTDLWESVIEETQSNYDVAHRPESLKSTNPITQTVTMFTTDIHQKFGLLFSAFDDYKTKSELHKKDATQTNQNAMNEAGARLVRASLSAIYSSLWMGAVSVLAHAILRKFKPYIDDEEKDITAGSTAKQYMMLVGEDLFNTAMPVGGSIISSAWNTFNKGYDFVSVPSVDVIEDFLKAMQKVYKASTEENGDVLGALKDSAYAISNFTGVPIKNISDLLGSIKGYAGDIIAGDFAHDLTDYTSGNKSFYNYGDLASYIVSGNKEKETKWLEYYSENGKEIAKGSLTKEIKPAYVQMYIDSPEKAENIKRKLILDYDYTEATIDDWGIAEYLKNVVSDFEYAEEIKSAMQKRSAWKSQDVYKEVKKYYKDVYKSGDEKKTKKLKDALLKSDGTYKNSFGGWEKEADSEIKKAEDAKNKEKAKYK